MALHTAQVTLFENDAADVAHGAKPREVEGRPRQHRRDLIRGDDGRNATGCLKSRRTGKESVIATQDISSLGLSSTAKKAAEALLKQYPDLEFTSGSRDLAEQARAMAGNVVLNRNWIKETYAKGDACTACQKWVDDNPEAKTKADIAAGLQKTLEGLGKKAGQISKHLTGDAFDVQPVTKDAAAIKKAIKDLPGCTKFLEREGGLVRWHAEF